MGANKGRPKPKGSTKPFQKGFDPRRNLAGGPKSDVRITEIKGEIKLKLAEFFHRFFASSIQDVKKFINNDELTVGERIAVMFLHETATKGDPARVSLLCKIMGLEVEKHEHEIKTTLEQLVIGSKEEEVV